MLYMYILIHAYMYSTESKVLGLDQIGVFQTTEPSLYMYHIKLAVVHMLSHAVHKGVVP